MRTILEKQLENAKKRYSKAIKKPYYNLTEDRRVQKQIETWSIRIDKLESKIADLKK